ncbi:prepilin-type N-terminal cleavage/methylation domain-containing protein [Coraliomargarita algicola]|uniref:Prepilin-type N-terminal cleavage/methylation domain-containing protein n=1 Tax=Coraliomargarita algicola TaxID=3092156 RepID=A0ABZ0RPC8_9BACT|nr:prepilin-type N-terminal cleavage/methylation domain-containing protein [Coraliomargarita sp. J2-16]WPJ97263.1 prepilin-type N-terminal cleavage/methylation domain-containing protein [Coraliomargarita sp. J2-16]
MSTQTRSTERGTVALPSGFTLIELLATIAIVAILAAILFPTVANVRQSVQQTECVSNMRQIGIATMAYVQDNNGRYPLSNEEASWDARLLPYLDHPNTETPCEALKCPSDVRNLVLENNKFARSYTASAPYTNSTTGNTDKRGMISGKYSRTIFELTNPPQTVLLTEWYTGAGGVPLERQQQFKESYSYITGWLGGESARGWPKRSDGQAYHGNVMNFCFADGHVESLPPWGVNTPKNRWTAID